MAAEPTGRQRTSSLLTRDHVLCPVTALAFFTTSRSEDGASRLYLLAGEDTDLVVYDAQQQQQRPTSPPPRARARCAVFEDQAVHGVRVDGAGDVLVWGASCVAVLSRGALERVIRGGEEEGRGASAADDEVAAAVVRARGRAPDLVYDGALCPADGGRGVLVTAHNEVVPFAVVASGSGSSLAMGPLVSPSRPILYSAYVTWTSGASVLVAGGTVFGEVVVWSYDVVGPSSFGQPQQAATATAAEVLHVFSGHEGSIFGVHISPEIEAVGPGGHRRRLLATCSDDRTIRVWDLATGGGGGWPPREAIGARAAEIRRRVGGEARETGFASEPEVAAAMELAERPLAVAMGHDSRIWGVRFACRGGGEKAGGVAVYSFGEDATTQEWRLDVPGAEGGWGCGTLTHVRTMGYHAGKHIWARDVLDREGRGALVATGGSDWKIVLIGDTSPEKENEIRDGQTVTLTVPDIDAAIIAAAGEEEDRDAEHRALAERAARAGKKLDKELLHSFEFISTDRILASTSLGRLFLGVFRPAGDIEWSTVRLDDSTGYDMVGYSVISSAKDGTAWIGCGSGCVYYYDRQGHVSEAFQVGRKIPDILFIPHSRLDDVPTTHVQLLVPSMAPEGGKLVTVDTAISGPDKSVAQWDVGRGEGLLITSASVCQGFLIVGTRRGTIHLYAKQDDQYMCVAWTKLQVKDAVTSLTPLPGRNGAPASNILATCRDGAYRIYAIDREPDTAALRLVHESSPPTMGPVQAGAVFAGDDNNNNELVVLGFRGTSFVAWNETRQEDVAAVSCGGANRKFAYVTSSGTADAAAAGGFLLRFAYTKTSTLNVYSQRGAAHRTIRAGGHGREVRSVCAAPGGGYVATGGEDTILRVWRRRVASGPGGGGGGDLRCVAVLNPHRTGIPALAWVGDGYLLSAGGFEDLYVWRVSRLDSAYEGLAVACESRFPDKSRDKDLRIMSIDAEPLGGDGVEEEDGMVVSMAFSNSAVKTYRYARADGWRLLAQGRYTGACPTEVRHLDVDARGERGLAVLVTFTDGHVTVWKADRRHRGSDGEAEYEDYTLQAAARLHQNSVKALDLVPLSTGAAAAGGWLVITGSDDNALGVTHLLPTAAGAVAAYTFGPGHRISKAHAAAINALRVVRHDEQAGAVVFVTGSNDQRIKTWRLLMTAPPGGEEEAGRGRRVGKIQLLDNSYSSVADPGAMEMLGSEGPLVVVGVGMETWGVGQGVAGRMRSD